MRFSSGVVSTTVFALVVAALSGCGSSYGSTADKRIDRCADRLAANATSTSLSKEQVRRYARVTYCERWDKPGWVYDDGALSISVVQLRKTSSECVSTKPGGPIRTVPCATLPSAPILDCAVLRHIRRSEVRAYLAEVRKKIAEARPVGFGGRSTPVRCDNGMPLADLGVP